MEILGIHLSPPAEELYREVLQLRPQESLDFARPTDDILEVSHLGAYLPNEDTGGTVFLGEEADLPVLIHELLHALAHRIGYIHPRAVAGYGKSYGIAVRVLANVTHHRVLRLDRERRQLPDTDPTSFVSKIAGWTAPEAPPPSSEGGMLNAWKIVELMDMQEAPGVQEALEHVFQRYPATYDAAKRLHAAAGTPAEASPGAHRRSMVRCLHVLNDLVLRDFPAVVPLKQVICLPPVLPSTQLGRSAERTIEFRSLANRTDIVGIFLKSDGTLSGISAAWPNIPSTLRTLRARARETATAEFLTQLQVPFTKT